MGSGGNGGLVRCSYLMDEQGNQGNAGAGAANRVPLHHTQATVLGIGWVTDDSLTKRLKWKCRYHATPPPQRHGRIHWSLVIRSEALDRSVLSRMLQSIDQNGIQKKKTNRANPNARSQEITAYEHSSAESKSVFVYFVSFIGACLLLFCVSVFVCVMCTSVSRALPCVLACLLRAAPCRSRLLPFCPAPPDEPPTPTPPLVHIKPDRHSVPALCLSLTCRCCCRRRRISSWASSCPRTATRGAPPWPCFFFFVGG